MRRATFIFAAFAALLSMTGCWNSVELDQSAFIQGAAMDITEDGMIELTAQIFKPTGEDTSRNKGGSSTGESIILKTRDASVFEAIRDITLHLGRKSQWTHTRMLIIGEKLAQKKKMGDLLDFYVRDYEPRPNIYISIGKGKGSGYLESKPFLESSMGQQLRKTEKMSYINAGKTLITTLMDLSLQLKSETEVAMLPYIYFDPKNKPSGAVVTGLTILKNGKMVRAVPSKKIEGLLMLIGKYKGGVIQTPCPDQSGGLMEAIEVEKVKTKTAVKNKGEAVSVNVSVRIDGYAGELSCSSLETSDEVVQFNKKVEKALERNLNKIVLHFQKQKLDVFGIGNRIFRENPALWMRLKPDWENRFARIPFKITVKVNTYNNGVGIGKPFGK